MVNQQLVDYIRSEESKGIPKEILVSNLVSQGWTPNDINEAYGIIQNSVPASLSQPTTSNEEYLSERKYFWIGLSGTCLMLVFAFYQFIINQPFVLTLFAKLGMSVSIVLLTILNIWIFNLFTRLFKVPNPSWRKALFMFGLSPILAVVVSIIIIFLLSFIPLLFIFLLSSILGLGCLAVWAFTAQKVYQIKFWKGFLLAFIMNLSTVLSALLVVFLTIAFFSVLPPVDNNSTIPSTDTFIPAESSLLETNIITNESEQVNNSESIYGTFFDLINKGKNLSCTFEEKDGDALIRGQVYTDGHSLKSDYIGYIFENIPTIEGHTLYKDTYSYQWGSQSNKGVKVWANKINYSENKYNYSCKIGNNLPENIFLIPTDITFSDVK